MKGIRYRLSTEHTNLKINQLTESTLETPNDSLWLWSYDNGPADK